MKKQQGNWHKKLSKEELRDRMSQLASIKQSKMTFKQKSEHALRMVEAKKLKGEVLQD